MDIRLDELIDGLISRRFLSICRVNHVAVYQRNHYFLHGKYALGRFGGLLIIPLTAY